MVGIKRYSKYALFIAFEIVLFLLIIFLATKIIGLHKNNVKGIKFVSKIYKNDIVFSPNSTNLKYFYEPKPNSISKFVQKWSGVESNYSINSDSLNEIIEYPISKDNDVFRIITIGDSFTFGLYVDQRSSYPKLLETSLNSKIKCDGISRFEVINLGVYGYDLEYAIQRLNKRGLKYNPDLVVWLVNYWNFEKINEYIIPITKQSYYQSIEQLDDNYNYLRTEKAYEELLNKYGLKFIKEYDKYVFGKINRHNEKLLIISFQSLNKEYKDMINHLAQENPLSISHSYISDISPIKSYIYPDGHPTEKGSKKIEEEIFTRILSEFLYTYGCTPNT